MRASSAVVLTVLGVVLGSALLASTTTSCRAPEPEVGSYYDRTIAPILQSSCSRQTTGCHVETPRGEAVGNLDTTSFAKLDRRRDLLTTYGPYPHAGLLVKVVGPQSLTVHGPEGPVTITTDVRHAAGAGVDVASDGFATLQRWIENGATQANVGRSSPAALSSGPCRATIPKDASFDPTVDPGPAFQAFVDEVQPVLRASCSAGTCHGSPFADLALTCGDDDAQRRWNAHVAAQYLSDPPESSDLLRRTLDPAAGGAWHAGGAVFPSTSSAGYQALLKWAQARGPAKIAPDDEGLRFFASRVQPLLVKKGCLFLGCHSPLSFHGYKPSGGSGGRFSLAATRKSYEASREMLAIEAPDPNTSRLIAKNLFPFDRSIDPGGLGIRHRGGPLLEDVPGVERSTPEACAKWDAEKDPLDQVPAYCVLVAWHAKERALAIARGPAAFGVDATPLRALFYVSRPPDPDVPQDFDRYRPGASLHRVDAELDAAGQVVLFGDVDVTARCGLAEASADVRRPAVSWDGTKVAFAARTSASTPLALYVIDATGDSCARLDVVSDHPASEHGILLHDFDPAWAPDGRLVFASTRGAIGQSDVEHLGPTRTPDGLRPNANLYVLEGGTIRQLTFMLGQELAPSFKHNGQLMFTVEKRAPGFYQLAGRRQNLDGSDYHPLYAQRASVGFQQLVDLHQLPTGDFLSVLSDRGALARAGTLGVANRSLGPDQHDRDPQDRGYLPSLLILDPAATGKPGSAGGAYRSPAILPAPSVIASWAPGADVGAFDGVFGLVQIDVRNGARRPLLSLPGRALVDAVAVFARPGRHVFVPEPGEFRVEAGARDAEVRNIDLPMIASLFFDNRRASRTIDPRIKALGVLESLPPPPGLVDLAAADPAFVTTDELGPLWVKRRRLGIAPTFDDDSIAYRIPGGMPFVLALYDGLPGSVLATQTEESQLYPGERAKASFRRSLFDAQCGGCHGAISGRETDVHPNPDVLTQASRAVAIDATPFDLVKPLAERGAPFGP